MNPQHSNFFYKKNCCRTFLKVRIKLRNFAKIFQFNEHNNTIRSLQSKGHFPS